MKHTHNCCRCNHEFQCHWKAPKDSCKTAKAVIVNKDGPYCILCLHLEMALRYAQHRNLQEVSRSLRRVQGSLFWGPTSPTRPTRPTSPTVPNLGSKLLCFDHTG
jgi:hypothetical protein